MSLHSIAAAGLRTIDQITTLHNLRFHPSQNGLAITVNLLTSSLAGAPVIDQKGQYLGFISEFDVLEALESERELGQLTAQDIMSSDPMAINISATLKDAVNIMKKHHVLVLPVEKEGRIVGCVTRKDLLRAWIGLGLQQQF